jgi:hypothetical protein
MNTAAHGMVSAAGLAQRLGLAASTVRQYAREGRIPVALRTPGGHARFIVEEAQAALANSNGTRDGGADSANTPIARRTFAPVPLSGDGELRFNAEGEPLQMAGDWQLRLAVGAVRIGADDFGELEPDPIVGVADGARFILDHDHALVGA